MFAVIVIVLCFSFSSCDKRVSYNGYKLLRVTPTTQTQLQQLTSLNRRSVGELDFWLVTTAVNQSADIIVPPSALNRLVRFLRSTRIPSLVLIDDLGEVIRRDSADGSRDWELNSDPGKSIPGLEFFAAYKSVNEINQYFFELKSDYPDIASVIDIGSSYEGRSIYLLRISTNFTKHKPAIWIQAGAHAREMIGPAVVTFIAQRLLHLFHKSNKVFELVNTFDWYLLPVLNPDGYEYCSIDRLWRKTRSRHPNNKNCIGVDANRNWDIKWNDASGSSSDPCSHTYAGPEAFSEPETKAVSNYLLEHLKGRLELFVDFHSYSQRWLSPWGYTSRLPPNYSEQIRLAEAAVKALERVNGTNYSVGSTGNIMYTVTGGARDWVYDVIGANYSYVVELRDKGNFGFLLPQQQILPTSLETWEAIKAMGQELWKISKFGSI